MAPRLLLAAFLVTALVVGAATLAGLQADRDRPQVATRVGPPLPVARTPAVRGAAVLREWDTARAAAWEAGDVGRLSALYTPGSGAGRRDRAMLLEWQRRGLTVRDLRTQVLALRELSRSPGRWVLRVTDRLAGGTAVGRGLRRSLPSDSATTTTVTLRRVAGRWLVESVSRS